MRQTTIALIVVATTIATTAQAAEEFGHFTSELVGTFVTVDGETRFRLNRPFGYLDPNGLEWDVPSEVITDGASIPPFFWPFIGHPMGGSYMWAAVVHDYFCEKRDRTSDATHRTFYYGMRALNLDDWKASLMYWAVATFGPQWRLESRIEQERNCETIDGREICTVVPVVRDVAVSGPSVDLTSPEVLAIAQDKFAAIARTLKTTDGEILDVSAFGNVFATADQIEQSAAAYRDILTTGAFRANPEQMGTMTDAWQSWDGFESVQAWPNGTLPAARTSPSWSEYVLDLDRNGPFSGQGSYVLNSGENPLREQAFVTNDIEILREKYTTMQMNTGGGLLDQQVIMEPSLGQ